MANPLFVVVLIGIIGLYVTYKEIKNYSLKLYQYRTCTKFYHWLRNKSEIEAEYIIRYKIEMYILLVVTYNVAIYNKVNPGPGAATKFEINANISVDDKNKISRLLFKLWEDINSYSNVDEENRKFVQNHIESLASN